ncbi:hypothetical protein ANTQUA_LOCUS1004 [Anthophora quadrimaculata]
MRDEVKMDANRLIAEVYKRPALWNQRHISYHNREVTNRVWMEIASIFKLPSRCIDEIVLSYNDNGLKIDSVNHIDVKQEPEENFDNLEFQSVSDNLTENEMMLQNISPEQVLMGDNDTNIGLPVDPLEGNRFDDNYYFLMSLLPHIRTLPADRRMLLRMQMQELVYKEVYKKNSDGVTAS